MRCQHPALAAALFLGVVISGPSARGADDARDLFADTWTAVDGLGRRLPDTAEVGPPPRWTDIGTPSDSRRNLANKGCKSPGAGAARDGV